MMKFLSMKNSVKGQSAVEFIILVSAVLFFFIAFAFAIQANIASKTNEKKDVVAKDTALTLQAEIDLAHQSTDGYYRKFRLPGMILDSDYEISIVEGLVYVRTLDGKHATAYPVADVFGDPLKGENYIRRDSGQVYLNS